MHLMQDGVFVRPSAPGNIYQINTPVIKQMLIWAQIQILQASLRFRRGIEWRAK